MAKVFLGVGHGGSDPGAVANGFEEADLNLAIALACKDELVRHGVEVKMSRTKDENDTLSEEIKEAIAYKPKLAIDIHNNAGGGDGAEVFHSKGDTKDDEFAKNVLDAITAIGQNSRGLKTKLLSDGKRDYFGFIRQINEALHIPSILVECAFVDTKDVQIIDTPAEQKAMGIAIAKGILKTLNIAYKSEDAKPTPIVPAKNNDFFPAKGYFCQGDTHVNVGKIASFMRRVFPSYTPQAALGTYYGPNIKKSITEFQRRTGLEADGCVGPITLAKLEEYGFSR